MRQNRLPLLAAPVAALALALISGPAAALEASKPAPCGPPAFNDPAGDATDQAFGKAPDNLDITSGFFRTDTTGTTANIEVANLSKAVPADSTAVVWRMLWTSDGTDYYTNAVVYFDGSEVFQYGTIIDAGVTSLSNPVGDTQGKFFEGPKGIVQLAIPADLAKAGAKFTATSAYSARGRIVPGANRGLNSLQDTAPDAGAGKSYTVEPCAEQSPATPATGPAAGQTMAGSSALPVKLLTKSAKAAKRKSKSKTLSLKLSSSEAITNLAAKLVKGSKVVGTGKLAKLSGTRTLKVKLKSKLKKGSYTLDLVGDRASGERATVAFKLKAK